MNTTGQGIYKQLRTSLLKKVVEELCLKYLVIYPDLQKLSKKLDNEQLEELIEQVTKDVVNYSQSS